MSEPNKNRSVDRVVDVVVVGYGGAGATAAICAHDKGAEVLVLEKASEGGGSTMESGGTIRMMKDARRAADHFEAMVDGATPRDLLDTYTHGIDELIVWLKHIGAEIVEWEGNAGYPPLPQGSAYPHLPGADAIGARVRVKPKVKGETGGQALWDALAAAVAKRGIDVVCGAPVKRLIQEVQGGPVVGVVYTDARGKDVAVRARRGVVLTCGGFAANKEMHRDYFSPIGLDCVGPPGRNTGDGIKMAMAVGADLWHMNAIAGPFGYTFPGHEAAFMNRTQAPNYIFVDRTARRYVDEADLEYHACALTALNFDAAQSGYPRIPSYIIFDEVVRKAGPVALTVQGWNRRNPWSQDNLPEIERGWIKRGETPAALARELGLDPTALTATVEEFNRNCAKGVDPRYGRKPEHMVPLNAPPYYGIEMRPCILNTQGGPRRNAKSQVVGTDREPVARLYAAGELGSIWGNMYPGGGNVTEALVFGRLAGLNVAAETPLGDR